MSDALDRPRAKSLNPLWALVPFIRPYKGMMIAALLAALMGGMASVFNSASTLVTLDFYKKLNPAADEKKLVNFGRFATGGMVILGLLWVPFIHLISSQLYIYLQSVQAYISPPIAVCFIFGILWPRMNGQGALAALMSGLVLGAGRFVTEVMVKTGSMANEGFAGWLVGINFLHYSILMFVVCAGVLIAVSLMGEAPARSKLAGLTFATVDDKVETVPGQSIALARESANEHRLNVVFSLVLVATVVGLWIHFA